MRAVYLLLGSLLAWSCQSSAYANLPVAKFLMPPDQNGSVLFAIPKAEIRADAPKFNLKSDDGMVVQIISSGAWAELPFSIYLERTDKGLFTVTALTYDLNSLPQLPSPAERKKLEKSTAGFDASLAARFVALLKKELLKASNREGKLPATDVTFYQYWSKINGQKLLGGETTSMAPENSRLGRLNRLTHQLRQLAMANDWERLEVLNAIDRSISEIELSYNLQ
jgi:hypothetical protein